MKGLIIKDLLSLKRYKATYTALLFFYIVFSFITKSLDFLNGMIVMISVLIVIGSFSLDDYAKWDKYAVSMPVSKGKIVLSKYVLVIIFTGLGALFSVLISAVGYVTGFFPDIKENLLSIYLLCCVAIIFLSILLPFLFRYGAEKSRIIMMILFGVIAILIYASSRLGLTLPTEEMINSLLYFSPLLLIILLFISIWISLKIYRKKQF